MSPAARHTRTLVRNGLAVYCFGVGPPVFLMPGPHRLQRPGLVTADRLVDGLCALERSVITFDPPGSGHSTRAARLGMPEIIDCAAEALMACGLSAPVDAVGHSMGGLALVGFTLARPDRVRRLVLIGTGTGGRAYLTAPGALWRPGHPGFPRTAALGTLHVVVRRLATERLLTNHITRWSYHDPAQAHDGPVRPGDWLRPAAGRTDWHRVARRIDYAPRLGEIIAPTLVLCGRHDPQYPPSCSEELAQGIIGASLHYFDRSGHYPFLEEPARFWPVVGRFLEGGSDASTRF